MRTSSMIVILLLFGSGTTQGGDDARLDVQTTAGDAAGQRPATKAAPLVMISAEGRLSLRASRPLLSSVIREISSRLNLPIVVADALARERVTVQLSDVPLDDALKQLLAGYDAFYMYTAEETLPGRIAAIWVYRRGEGRDLMPVPPESWASTEEIEKRLDDPDPEVRIRALETLLERDGDGSLPAVLKSLADGEDPVRLATLGAAVDAGVEIPTARLTDLALGDPVAEIRFIALQELESRPEAASVAAVAQNDPSDLVSNQAKQILQRKKSP